MTSPLFSTQKIKSPLFINGHSNCLDDIDIYLIYNDCIDPLYGRGRHMRNNKIVIGLAALCLVMSGCSLTITTVDPEHEHTYADTYSFDDDYHWFAATCEHTELTKDKEEHSYDEWVIDRDATETETGLMHRDCLKCDYVQTSTIDVLPHEHTPGEPHEENRVEPTCTEPGGYDIVIRCLEDNEIISSEHHEIEAKGHDYIHHDGKPATCTEDGYSEYDTCSRCDYSSYTVIPATGHQHLSTRVENEVPATCTQNGGYDVITYCLDDDVVISSEHHVINKLGHDIVHHDGKPATCTEPGYEEYDTCSRCDYTTFVEIPAKGHQNVEQRHENEIEPTCTKAGSYELVTYCLDDDVELSRETVYVAPLGHDIVHHDGKPATCTEEGYAAYDTCTRCDYSTYKVIPATGHQHRVTKQENIVEPTCTEQGHYDLVTYCTDDDVELSRKTYYTAALGHDYESVETDPTYEASGYITHKCTRCGDEYITDGKPQLVHTYAEEWSVDAVLGTHYHVCLDPGYEELRGEEAYHSFEWIKTSPTHQQYRCTVCGYVEDEGDIEELGDLYKLKFTLKEDDTYMVEALDTFISGYVNIPDTYRGKPVTSIGGAGFVSCTQMTSIRLPVGLTDLGNNRFLYTYKLCEIINCSSLEITAGSSTYGEIARSVFQVIPDISYSNLETTEDGFVLYHATNYTLVVNYVGEDVDIVIPVEATGIRDHAFQYVGYLTSVVVPDHVKSIPFYAFYGCGSLESVDIGNGVTSINEYAFAYCTSLKNVSIGDGINKINSYAFYKAFQQYSEVTIGGEDVNLISSSFYDTPYLSIVEFTKATKLTFGYDVFTRNNYANMPSLSLLVPDTLEEFNYNSDYSFRSIRFNVNTTGSVNYLGNLHNPFVVAYQKVGTPSSISLEDGCRIVADNFYKSCSSLTKLTLPKTLVNIGDYAFAWGGLTSLSLPNSLQYIGEYAFYDNGSLKTLNMGTGVEKVEAMAFSDCAITNLSLSSSLSYIGEQAFSRLKVTSLTLPASVRYIGTNAFSGSESIKTLTMSEGIETIDEKAFQDLASVTKIEIPNSVTTLGESACRWCTKMTYLSIGDGITYIPSNAFYGCSALKTIVIGSGVSNINIYAFTGCTAITTIYYHGTPQQWSRITNLNSGDNKNLWQNSTRYYYSETAPTDTEFSYWHYVDGVPTKW